jgi:hypothetical protein
MRREEEETRREAYRDKGEYECLEVQADALKTAGTTSVNVQGKHQQLSPRLSFLLG